MNRLSKILVVAFLVMALVLPMGCTSQPASDEGEGEPEGTEPTTPAEKVVFTYVESQVIGTIDPAKHTDESSHHGVLNLYDALLFPKVFEGSMEPGPHVATSWEVSDDAKTYTFTLRDDIKFHNGDPLTAEDVKFSIERALAIKQGFSWLWQGVVDSVEVIDDQTVAFHLTQPYAPFLSTLVQLFVVNKDEVLANKEDGDYGEFGDYGQAYLEDHEAGSGPYTLKSWTRGSEFVFEKFDDYWMGWEPGQIDEVHYLIVPEEATRKTMLKSGEADMVDMYFSQESFDELAKADGIVVDEQPSVQLFHLPMHTQKAPTDDIHFRKAIAYAFDYDTANEVMNGVQAQGPVPNLAWGHNDNVFVYHQDMDKAKEELAQSEYDPADYTLQYVYSASVPIEQKIGLLLKSNLQELGIEMEIIPEPWARITELSSTMESTPHLLAIYDTLKYPHPDSHTYGLYHPNSHGSYRSTSWLDVPEVTEALDQARLAVDPDEQLELYKEVQDLIVAQCPSVYVTNQLHRIAYRDYVKGYQYIGLLGFDNWFYKFRIEK